MKYYHHLERVGDQAIQICNLNPKNAVRQRPHYFHFR